ncbi:MAG: methylmalonyl-CoA mutase family protein [Verrucomicrobiota bacterium]
MNFSLPETIDFSEFPDVSYAQWREAVQAYLGDKNFDQSLISLNYEGMALQPVYCEGEDMPHPGMAPFARGNHAGGYLREAWEISQQLGCVSAREFNAAAKHGLARGLTCLNLNLDHATRQGLDPDWAKEGEVGQGGVSISTLKELSQALEDIDLEKIPVFVRSGSSGLPFAALFLALVRERGFSLQRLKGCIEMDPLGVLSHEGTLPQSIEGAYREMSALTQWACKRAQNLQTICVHGRPYHESGGSAMHELAFAVATGVEYLREMTRRGLSVDAVASRMRFAFLTGSNFFMEIAKIRAARMIWSQIISAWGGSEESKKMHIHSATDFWNKSTLDPHVNLLRTTTQAFAAILGGCEILNVRPFDEPLGAPDEFSRRMARNTQIILKSEMHLKRLIDPAGGSWYVENLTQNLAQEAWKLFQEVERQGGMLEALKKNFIQNLIEKTAEEKTRALRTRKDVLVGVNRYANPDEKKQDSRIPDLKAIYNECVQLVREYRTSHDNALHSSILQKLAGILDSSDENLLEEAIGAAAVGATLGEITRVIRARDGERPRIQPLKPHRIAEDFENLRRAADAWKEKTGHRPRVFLANMGSKIQHKARADFSREFFQTGGFEIISSDGFSSPEEAGKAAAHSGASIAVLCSTDETYPALVPAFVGALKKEKPEMIAVLAGYPKDQVEAHRAAGVDEFIYMRADIVEILQKLFQRIGVMS